MPIVDSADSEGVDLLGSDPWEREDVDNFIEKDSLNEHATCFKQTWTDGTGI
jgi:hypothetical protein